MSKHVCHAKKCKVEVPPKMLMCRKHWYMVPKKIQQRVWKHYVPGQEISKTPTRKYLKAAQAAVDAVAEREAA